MMTFGHPLIEVMCVRSTKQSLYGSMRHTAGDCLSLDFLLNIIYIYSMYVCDAIVEM